MITSLGDATAIVHEWADATDSEVSGPAGMTMLGSPLSAHGSFFTVRIDTDLIEDLRWTDER